jgi:hypothetical protein
MDAVYCAGKLHYAKDTAEWKPNQLFTISHNLWKERFHCYVGTETG